MLTFGEKVYKRLFFIAEKQEEIMAITVTDIRKQERLLNISARSNMKLGNDLLASWMFESAEKLAKKAEKIDRQLSKMALGNYGNKPLNRCGDFKKRWYKSEEENFENWEGVE